MAEKVADALNSLASSNIRGHVNELALRELINDYFGGGSDVDSELSSESEDEAEDDDARSLAAALADTLDPNLTSAEESEAEGIDDSPIIVNVVPAIIGTVPDAVSSDDEVERQRITTFSCRCQHFSGGPCYQQFSAEFVLSRRREMQSLTEGLYFKFSAELCLSYRH